MLAQAKEGTDTIRPRGHAAAAVCPLGHIRVESATDAGKGGQLVCLQPVGPRADAYLQRDAQLGVDGLHRRAYEVGDFVEFVQGDVEIEFVMHLQQDLGA